MRLGAMFVAVCIILIAGSAGAVAYFAVGFDRIESVIVAAAVMTALGLYNVLSARLGVRTVAGSQLSSLSHSNADMARQIAELEQNLAALERRVATALDQTRAATDPLTLEIGELSTLLRQLAETVSSHETRLVELARAPQATTTTSATPHVVE